MIELLGICAVCLLVGYLLGYMTNQISMHNIDFDEVEDINVSPTYMTFRVKDKTYTYIGDGSHWVDSSGRICSSALTYELDKIWLKGMRNKDGKSSKDIK